MMGRNCALVIRIANLQTQKYELHFYTTFSFFCYRIDYWVGKTINFFSLLERKSNKKKYRNNFQHRRHCFLFPDRHNH